jgi:hypothetical protein
MALITFAILIGTWQFSTNLTSDPLPSVVIPVPTPSTEPTATIARLKRRICYHRIQEGDTWPVSLQNFPFHKRC